MNYGKYSADTLRMLKAHNNHPDRLKAMSHRFGVLCAAKQGVAHRAVVFLRTAPDENLEDLNVGETIISPPPGHVRTAVMRLTKLHELYEDERIKRIAVARHVAPMVNAARGNINLSTFLEATRLTGKGVIIGIVDTGVDNLHPAFQKRITAYWDQTAKKGKQTPPEGFGREYDASNLPSKSLDPRGHGTHVAGIAAGNLENWPGIAPEANLVVVKTTFLDTDIVAAVRYIFRKAGEFEMPAVVNLSLGRERDAHDGTDEFSVAIDELSCAGRIICCAAGNSGGKCNHAKVDLCENQIAAVPFNVPRTAKRKPLRIMEIEGWFEGDPEIEIALETPNYSCSDFYGPALGGSVVNPFKEIFIDRMSNHTIEFLTPRLEGPMGNGDTHFHLYIESQTALAEGDWTLLVKSSGKGILHLWLFDDGPGQDVRFHGRYVDDSTQIDAPAAAPSAIAVGACNSTLSWRSYPAHDNIRVGKRDGWVADFSSRGPLRNGVEKPDLVAPGAYVASAKSSTFSPEPHLQVDPEHYYEAGTSMSAPIVSGVIALMLQKRKDLTPEDIRTKLKAVSVLPEQSVKPFDPAWGYGLLDARRLVDLL